MFVIVERGSERAELSCSNLSIEEMNQLNNEGWQVVEYFKLLGGKYGIKREH